MPPIPAAPVPHPRRLTLLRAVRALRTNPITVFAEAAFEEPTLELDRRGKILLVSDPGLIEHVLIGNASNYCKSVQLSEACFQTLTVLGLEFAATLKACQPDYNRMCANVPPGFGRGLDCLMRNADALSASCRAALEGGEPFDAAPEPPSRGGKLQP